MLATKYLSFYPPEFSKYLFNLFLEHVTPLGIPAIVKPINIGIDEQEQFFRQESNFEYMIPERLIGTTKPLF